MPGMLPAIPLIFVSVYPRGVSYIPKCVMSACQECQGTNVAHQLWHFQKRFARQSYGQRNASRCPARRPELYTKQIH